MATFFYGIIIKKKKEGENILTWDPDTDNIKIKPFD